VHDAAGGNLVYIPAPTTRDHLTERASTAAPRFFPADVVAGLTIALALIPQSLAYADLAGMPPEAGLYAAMLAPIAAAFLASSPYLQTGPVALTSLLTLAALSPLAPAGSATYIALAALLAVVVGVLRATLGLLRFGWLAFLLSEPVLLGFSAGAAILIVASQLPAAVGASAPDGAIIARAWWTVSHVSAWQGGAVALSLLAAVLVFGGRRLHPLFPGVLVALGAGIVATRVFGYGGALLGAVPVGLPPFSFALPWRELPLLLVPGLVIALVGFAEPAAIARTYAAKDRQVWDADRELVSQGVANVAAGLSGGFPVGGSWSRTAITRLAGGRTRWSGAVAGIAVLLLIPVAGVLAAIPRASLAAIVIAAVVPLVRVAPLVALGTASPPQAAVAWVTFVATLVLAPHVERAVMLGVGIAIVVHIWRELRIHVRARYAAGTLLLEPKGVLFFASAPALYQAFMEELARHPAAERLEVDLRHLGRIDLTGAIALKDLLREAEQAGLAVELTHAPPQSWRLIKKVLGVREGAARE
jgi:SulP family sulfate permease